MKIVILTYAEVDGLYAATLMERGHEVAFFGGGAIHAAGMKQFSDYDGCLLLGTDPELIEFSDLFAAMDKKVWHQLADIPKQQ